MRVDPHFAAVLRYVLRTHGGPVRRLISVRGITFLTREVIFFIPGVTSG